MFFGVVVAFVREFRGRSSGDGSHATMFQRIWFHPDRNLRKLRVGSADSLRRSPKDGT